MKSVQGFESSWILMSSILLLIYLGFFHICHNASYAACIAAGLGSTAVWFSVCYAFRQSFLSRFEFLIHLVVGLDIFVEGFNPFHQGYGFYFCAVGFWSVFLTYRFCVVNLTLPEVTTIGSAPK